MGTTAESGGRNYVITVEDEAEIAKGGAKTRYRANVEAIKLLKQIEAEGRPATPEEQAVLVKYTGWGGIPQAFDSDGSAFTDRKQAIDILHSYLFRRPRRFLLYCYPLTYRPAYPLFLA